MTSTLKPDPCIHYCLIYGNIGVEINAYRSTNICFGPLVDESIHKVADTFPHCRLVLVPSTLVSVSGSLVGDLRQLGFWTQVKRLAPAVNHVYQGILIWFVST